MVLIGLIAGKNREKDLQLIEQSKMAALGEMISNIAHQWRQPLSEISTCATGLKLQKEFGKFSDEDFYNGMDIINNKTQYLSKTIETFRNFLIEKKEFKELSLQEEIDKLLLIVNETLNINYDTESSLGSFLRILERENKVSRKNQGLYKKEDTFPAGKGR